MALQTLKDWFKFMIYPQAGGTTPELRDLSEIRDWLIDTANDPELLALIQAQGVDVDAVKAATIDDPGAARKLAAFSNATDIVYEILYHKFLKQPLINDTAADRSEAQIVTDPAGYILLQAVAFGDDTNGYSIEVIEDGEEAVPLSCTCSAGGAIVVNLATDSNGTGITTVAELVAALRATENVNSLINIYPNDCNLTDLVVAMSETSFSGGVDGTPLTSTAAEIDSAVAKSPVKGKAEIPVASTGSIKLAEEVSLDFTAKTKGEAGDLLIVTLIDPEAEGAISVAVNGNEINVTLASSAVPAITSTAADVKAAIEADTSEGGANSLISVEVTGLDTTLAIEETAEFTGGIDGVVGVAGAMRFDADAFYVSIEESTVSTSNWVKYSKDAE